MVSSTRRPASVAAVAFAAARNAISSLIWPGRELQWMTAWGPGSQITEIARTDYFAKVAPCTHIGIRSRSRSTRAQSEECQRRHPSASTSRLHGYLRVRQVIISLWHLIRGGAATLFGVGGPLRTATVSSTGCSAVRRNRGHASGCCPAAAARVAHDSIVGGKRHYSVEPVAHAVFASR